MWTKAEMDKLTVEQQDVVARFELSIARQREQLLKEARGDSNRRNVLEGISFAVLGYGFFVLFFHASQKGEMYVWYACSGLLLVNALLYIHTARVHRRLDALLKLLDFDRKSKDDSNNSKTEKAG
jgi:hypothetical protein